MTRKRILQSDTPSIANDRHHKWRKTPDGISWAVDQGGPIQPDTLDRLLSLLYEKTDCPHHVAVEVQTGAVLKTIDNEHDAQETIRRLDSVPSKRMAPPPPASGELRPELMAVSAIDVAPVPHTDTDT